MVLPEPTWRNVLYPPAGYRYFRGTAFQGGVRPERDLVAAWMADCAMLAYGRDGEARLPWDVAGLKLREAGFGSSGPLGNWERPGPQGYFAARPELFVVAFRGTEANDPTDLLTDLDAFLVTEPPVPAEGLSEQPGDCQVHGGFKEYLDALWPDTLRSLSECRKQYPAAEICFTGHSMGAAMATIASARFRGRCCSLYTFGCPRTGNSVLHDRAHANTGGNWFRFVNHADLVTTVPLALFQYRHDRASLRHIDEDGRISKDDPAEPPLSDVAALVRAAAAVRVRFGTPLLDQTPPAALVDHSPGRYCELLWNRARTAN